MHSLTSSDMIYILHSLSINPKSFCFLESIDTARNRCRVTIRRAKHTFTKWKCTDLLDSPTDKNFWPLAKNIFNNFCKTAFPHLIRSDGCVAKTRSKKANLFGLLFPSNLTLDDSG